MDERTTGGSEGFYAGLAPFDDFAGIGEEAGYSPLPDDWHLFACDIVRSGDAIAAGRYKDVNLVGAAAITAILNASDGVDVPFVFGGDGAMVAVPGTLSEKAADALAGVRQMANDVMGLSLRAARFPVAALRQEGADLRVRKFELSPGNHLAMFTGGGLELADRILKDERLATGYLIGERAQAVAALDGLSCRWEPLLSKNGQIVSLMVRSRTARQGNAEAGAGALMREIDAILGTTIAAETVESRPVRNETLRHRFPPSGFMREVRVVGFRSGLVKTFAIVLFECLAAAYAYASGKRVGPFDPKSYVVELQKNTDFRKFDDMLRLVLDLTNEQTRRLETFLHRKFAEGEIVYGLHKAKSALMTCLVFSIEQSRHIHFVDGGNGGLSEAARDFKARLQPLEKHRAAS